MRRRIDFAKFSCIFWLAVIAGCSHSPIPLEEPYSDHFIQDDTVGNCARFFRRLDQAVVASRVGDAQATRIPGFPYLRVDRFLSSYRNEVADRGSFDFWVARMRILDQQARAIEIANLPPDVLPSPRGTARYKDRIMSRATECAEIMRKVDLAGDAGRERLRARTIAGEEYDRWRRIAGVYPLTALLVLHRVIELQKKTRKTFSQPLDKLPVVGAVTRYAPSARDMITDRAEIAEIITQSSQNPLNIPLPDEVQKEKLFAAFAPVYELDVVTDDDRPGTPIWRNGEHAIVDSTMPRVFRRISHVRYQGDVLIQLNYTVWFRARPRTGPLDLLGGNMDGINWRVTLGKDGQPLIHDAIHNCGCYHMFFPTIRLRTLPQSGTLREPLWISQFAPHLDFGERMVLRIAHRTHYIERIYIEPRPRAAVVYSLADYHELRSLVHGTGRRSLFGPDGIVVGTERLERWLLWPMGIPHPGAMRQWGHHATAFVGRRHFDDPDILERYFEIRAHSKITSHFGR